MVRIWGRILVIADTVIEMAYLSSKSVAWRDGDLLSAAREFELELLIDTVKTSHSFASKGCNLSSLIAIEPADFDVSK